ncbi:MAG: hypothetical protein ISR69_13900 [Gammaproteobacteria bacterium]|nr:hypothetical protein [Gammaproteobacteria bacterium]
MDNSNTIFMMIMAFVDGYAIAYATKNIGRIWNRWGGLISFIFFPALGTGLIFTAAIISDLNNNTISLIFALGFIIRMLKKDD